MLDLWHRWRTNVRLVGVNALSINPGRAGANRESRAYIMSHKLMFVTIFEKINIAGIQLLSKNGFENGSPVFWLIPAFDPGIFRNKVSDDR